MPIIKVWCLPKSTEEELNMIHKAIVAAVVSIKELKIKDENSMIVLFPPDMMKYGLGEEVIVEISGLFEKPGRTVEVRQRLAKRVGEAVALLNPDAKVECFVQTFNQNKGFWTSET